MLKETPKITKNKWMEEPLTRGKMEPIIKDLKEFITSTVRGSENVLGGKIEKLDKRVALVEAKIEATQHFVGKMEKHLDEKIEGVRTELSELSEKMDRVISKVDSHETRLSAAEEKIETHLTAHP